MKTTILNYNIIVEKEKDKNEVFYQATAPTLNISDSGETIDEALKNIEEAIHLYLDGLKDIDMPIPNPDENDYFVVSRKFEISQPFAFA